MGDTLHKKVVLVDSRSGSGIAPGESAWLSIGSWNMHPRSVRFEGEHMVIIHSEPGAGQNTAAAMQAAFENDLAGSRPYDVEALAEEIDGLNFYNKFMSLICESL